MHIEGQREKESFFLHFFKLAKHERSDPLGQSVSTNFVCDCSHTQHLNQLIKESTSTTGIYQNKTSLFL